MMVKFSEPTVGIVQRILKHPAFAGFYLYGKRHWRRVRAGGEPVPQHRAIGQFVLLERHHEGYILPEEYEQNQELLALNRKAPGQSQLGPGPALLPWRVRCGKHTVIRGDHHRAMSVTYYSGVKKTRWYYRCPGDYLLGGEQCVSVPGAAIESQVVEAALSRLDESVIDEAREMWRREHRDWQRRHAGIQVEVARLEEGLARLRRLLVDDNGTRPHLRAMWEDEYEQKARQLEDLKRRASQAQKEPDPFTEARWADLAALCRDVRAIWQATTTEDHDRKQLLRLLVEAVVIELVDKERLKLRVEWTDGAPPTLIEIFRSPYFRRMIWELHHAGKMVDDIVAALAEIGARTERSRAWSKETVRRTILFLKVRNPENR